MHVFRDSNISPIMASPTAAVLKQVEFRDEPMSSIDKDLEPFNYKGALILQNYRIETKRNYFDSEKQFMMTSCLQLDIDGFSPETKRYCLRIHSICHPRSERSKSLVETKLTKLNKTMEKHTFTLIELMNKRGLKLFTDDEERVRMNFNVMEEKMSRFFLDQLYKALSVEIARFEGSCSSIMVLEKEAVCFKTGRKIHII